MVIRPGADRSAPGRVLKSPRAARGTPQERVKTGGLAGAGRTSGERAWPAGGQGRAARSAAGPGIRGAATPRKPGFSRARLGDIESGLKVCHP